MDEWAYELAKSIKGNRPPKVMGSCIGETVSVSPFLVKLQDGGIILDKDNAYVCRQLLGRKSKYKAKGNLKQSGTLNASCPSGSHSSYSADGTFAADGEIELATVWQPGDKVLVVPSGNGQSFFIVDILEG